MFLNLQLLKYFGVVAKTQHFTRAAQELYISQSTLSKAIDALENEIGVPLFERTGRNVHLTRYGAILLEYVQRGTSEMESGLQMIQSIANSQTGTIYVASLFTLGAVFMPKAIKEFIGLYPQIYVKYYQKATSAILEELLSGDLDLGFCGELPIDSDYNQLSSEIIETEELCLVVRPDHRLAQRKSIDFKEVADETFIGYNEDTGMALSINQALSRGGISTKLKYSFLATFDDAITGLVREGLGIGLISTTPSIYADGLVKIKIDRPFLYRNLYMVWNRQRYISPAADTFRRFILSREKQTGVQDI